MSIIIIIMVGWSITYERYARVHSFTITAGAGTDWSIMGVAFGVLSPSGYTVTTDPDTTSPAGRRLETRTFAMGACHIEAQNAVMALLGLDRKIWAERTIQVLPEMKIFIDDENLNAVVAAVEAEREYIEPEVVGSWVYRFVRFIVMGPP
jgi:hypothetical protein